MFSQLACYFKQKAAKVILIAQPAIVNLLKSSLDIDKVIPANCIEKMLPDFDYWTYPHDILATIKKPFTMISKRSPYLFANKNKIKQFKSLFPQTQNLKVGIVWRGNPAHENDGLRSIHNLSHIERLFNIKNIDWYAFQKECNEDELALLNKYHIPHITKDFNCFTDTAAAMMHLDYLITVDTSSAHVAGAIGVPTLLLLPYIGDWRWGIEGENNVWYPAMRSFRCDMPFPDWTNVFNELEQYLIKRIQQAV